LMKNQTMQKILSLKILEEMVVRQNIHFKNHLTKKLCIPELFKI